MIVQQEEEEQLLDVEQKIIKTSEAFAGMEGK